MNNQYRCNFWLRCVICFVFFIMCANSAPITQVQGMTNVNKGRFEYDMLYLHYLHNGYDYDIGIRSGWLSQRSFMKPYIDFAWQIPISPSINVGIKSLIFTENKIENRTNFYNAFVTDQQQIVPELVEVHSREHYLNLSIMPWASLALTNKIRYVFGLILPNFTNNVKVSMFNNEINSALLNILKFNVSNYDVYLGGIYDFSQNHVFGVMGFNFLTMNLNDTSVHNPEDHFLTSANIHFKINPSVVLHTYFDEDADVWRDTYFMNLVLGVTFENHAIRISPGIKIYYDFHSNFPPNLGFFVNLLLLQI